MIVDAARSERTRGGRPIPALEHVANRPILHHVLDGFSEAAVSEVILAGDADALIDVRASVDGYGAVFDSVKYVVAREGTGLGATLRAVAPVVDGCPCLIQPADGLLDAAVGPLIEQLAHGEPDMLMLMARERGPRRAVDIGVFAEGALPRAIEAVTRNGVTDLAAVGKTMSAVGSVVRAITVDGWLRYRGNGDELLELNRIALDRVHAEVPDAVRSENRIEGRVAIHPSASVSESVIVGPAVIGENASIGNAYIGPYTAIGADVRIEGAEIERSIVAPGASVMHVGDRIMASLLGRNARIFRDFTIPRAMRLWISDDDEIALC